MSHQDDDVISDEVIDEEKLLKHCKYDTGPSRSQLKQIRVATSYKTKTVLSILKILILFQAFVTCPSRLRVIRLRVGTWSTRNIKSIKYKVTQSVDRSNLLEREEVHVTWLKMNLRRPTGKFMGKPIRVLWMIIRY